MPEFESIHLQEIFDTAKSITQNNGKVRQFDRTGALKTIAMHQKMALESNINPFEVSTAISRGFRAGTEKIN